MLSRWEEKDDSVTSFYVTSPYADIIDNSKICQKKKELLSG